MDADHTSNEGRYPSFKAFKAEAKKRGGFTQTPTKVTRDGRLSPQARTLYGIILSYWYKGTEKAFPSQTTLCLEMGFRPGNNKHVRRLLDELVVGGLLDKVRRGPGMTLLYKPLSLSIRYPDRGNPGSVDPGSTGPTKKKNINLKEGKNLEVLEENLNGASPTEAPREDPSPPFLPVKAQEEEEGGGLQTPTEDEEDQRPAGGTESEGVPTPPAPLKHGIKEGAGW